MKVKLKARYAAVGAVLTAVVIGSGVAYAVWSVSGAGSGSGAATVVQPVTVAPVTPSGSAATLYPGGPAGPVYVNLTNPNPFAITITGYDWGTPTSQDTTTCPNANISLSLSAPTTANLSLTANQTLSGVQINGVLQLAHTAPDGCQGVGFNIPLTVSGTQQ